MKFYKSPFHAKYDTKTADKMCKDVDDYLIFGKQNASAPSEFFTVGYEVDTDEQIKDLAEAGCSMDEIQELTLAGTCCGSCIEDIEDNIELSLDSTKES